MQCRCAAQNKNIRSKEYSSRDRYCRRPYCFFILLPKIGSPIVSHFSPYVKPFFDFLEVILHIPNLLCDDEEAFILQGALHRGRQGSYLPTLSLSTKKMPLARNDAPKAFLSFIFSFPLIPQRSYRGSRKSKYRRRSNPT